MNPEPTVFLLDDDQAVLDSLKTLLKSVGQPVICYSCAKDFLENCDPSQPGCLVLDIRLPGMGGLEIIKELPRRGIRLPVIVITGYADVSTAVSALKAGALDFIEKPFSNQILLDCIYRAIQVDLQNRRRETVRNEVRALLAQLTAREGEVLHLILAGKAIKEIAAELGISRKTLDIHRRRIFEKMRAETVVDLAYKVQKALGSLERDPQSAGTPCSTCFQQTSVLTRAVFWVGAHLGVDTERGK
jgi:FixJ family two-component response regulator